MSEGWGFADIYDMDPQDERREGAPPVREDEWRNILVWGRATKDGVYPETLSLVGRARHMADELGCRVEVLLIGKDLDAATEVLKKYPVDHVYRVEAEDYLPLDASARVLEDVVRQRRPEMVLVFQSRTGDAVTAYAAARLGLGFVIGALEVEVDTMERRAVVVHQGADERFRTRTAMVDLPQFVSVRRGLFRAPMEDPYAQVRVFDLDVDPGRVADIKVVSKEAPEPPGLATAERVVVAGGRVADDKQLARVRDLAARLDAVCGVAQSLVDRGLADAEDEVSRFGACIRPKLLVTVGARGSLDFFEAIGGDPVIAAIGSMPGDPIAKRATYLLEGDVDAALDEVLGAFDG